MTINERSYAIVENLEDVRQGEYFATPWRCNKADANLISSRLEGFRDEHMPAIDIDFPCRLVPSRTPGHFHLYIDKVLDGPTYFNLLDAMARAHIVQRGYAEASRQHGASFLRTQPLLGTDPRLDPDREPFLYDGSQAER